jgi:hypothetical protein
MQTERTYHRWTPAEEKKLRDHYDSLTRQELADLLGVSLNAVKRKAYDLRLIKSEEAIAAIAARPNVGQFRKGEIAPNKMHYKDGDITTRVDMRGVPYKWIRISQAVWQPLHVYVFQKAHGPLPKSHIVVFKSTDTLNTDLSNLEMISKADNLARNRHKKEGSGKKKKTELKKIRRTIRKQEQKAEKKRQQRIQPKATKKITSAYITQQIRDNRKEKPSFQTRQIDYTQKVLLKIDAKTSIYINAGEDPEQAKQKYLEKVNASREFSLAKNK